MTGRERGSVSLAPPHSSTMVMAPHLIFTQALPTTPTPDTGLQLVEAPVRGAGGDPDQGGLILRQLPVAKSKGLRSYCFTSEAGKAVILEEPGGVTGVVSLRKTKKSRGLREMANSVTGTIRRGVRLRRSLALSWEGTFTNPPHWSTDSICPPLEYVR